MKDLKNISKLDTWNNHNSLNLTSMLFQQLMLERHNTFSCWDGTFLRFKHCWFQVFVGSVFKGWFNFFHPWNLTWTLKRSPWKRRFLFQETIVFRFHVKFWGSSWNQLVFLIQQLGKMMEENCSLGWLSILGVFFCLDLHPYLWLTPWKINMVHLQITHLERNMDLPNLHDTVPC